MAVSVKLIQACFDIPISNLKLAREEHFCFFCKYGLQKRSLSKIKQKQSLAYSRQRFPLECQIQLSVSRHIRP